MTAIYGHKWLTGYGEAADSSGQLTAEADVWRAGLAQVGMEGIRRGLEQCILRNDPWPPSLPEFRAMCQITPEELGLPDFETAYRVAASQRPDWGSAHPIIWHARQIVGAYDMTRLPDAEARRRFAAAYQTLVQRAMAGEVFTYPVTQAPQLEQDKPVEVTAHGDPKAHLAAMRALLRVDPLSGQTDPAPEQPKAADPPATKPEPFRTDPKRRAELRAEIEKIIGTRREAS